MFAALGAEPRLRIMRLLLSAHPDGLVVNEIQAETGIAGSTLSHHLEKLKNDELVTAEREKAFIRYRANTDALEELLGLPLRRVLHPQQGRRAQEDRRALQIRRPAMNTDNVKDVVREKYGQAALRAQTGAGNACCGGARGARSVLRSDHVESVRRRPGRRSARTWR